MCSLEVYVKSRVARDDRSMPPIPQSACTNAAGARRSTAALAHASTIEREAMERERRGELRERQAESNVGELSLLL